MLERPLDLAWSHWPPRSRPRQFILLLAIVILSGSLVYYWLGLSWESNVLMVAFIFSLRNLLFARSVLLAEDGLSLSHPLTGARCWKWPEIAGLELENAQLYLSLLNKQRVELPAPPGALHAKVHEWHQWLTHPQRAEK